MGRRISYEYRRNNRLRSAPPEKANRQQKDFSGKAGAIDNAVQAPVVGNRVPGAGHPTYDPRKKPMGKRV